MSNTLDSKEIAKLAEILDKKNLTELEYETENFRLCLTRDSANGAVTPNYVMQNPTIAAPLQQLSQQIATPAPSAVAVVAMEEDYSKHVGAVKSPMVGVVYLASAPTVPDYVSIGDVVKEGDTVCLIEAMKTFNPVKATKGGKVTKILVTGGDPVEYGEPLIIIE